MFQLQKEKHIGLRCTAETLRKLKYLAAYEGRSINGELLYLIHSASRTFESENGVIDEQDELWFSYEGDVKKGTDRGKRATRSTKVPGRARLERSALFFYIP